MAVRPMLSLRHRATMLSVCCSLSRHDTIGTFTGNGGLSPVTARRDGGRS